MHGYYKTNHAFIKSGMLIGGFFLKWHAGFNYDLGKACLFLETGSGEQCCPFFSYFLFTLCQLTSLYIIRD